MWGGGGGVYRYNDDDEDWIDVFTGNFSKNDNCFLRRLYLDFVKNCEVLLLYVFLEYCSYWLMNNL